MGRRVCAARTRTPGKRCGRAGNSKNGRCRWHGGLSTSAKSLVGKLKREAARRAGYARYRASLLSYQEGQQNQQVDATLPQNTPQKAKRASAKRADSEPEDSGT
jgi:hypothetical protein